MEGIVALYVVVACSAVEQCFNGGIHIGLPVIVLLHGTDKEPVVIEDKGCIAVNHYILDAVVPVFLQGEVVVHVFQHLQCVFEIALAVHASHEAAFRVAAILSRGEISEDRFGEVDARRGGVVDDFQQFLAHFLVEAHAFDEFLHVVFHGGVVALHSCAFHSFHHVQAEHDDGVVGNEA